MGFQTQKFTINHHFTFFDNFWNFRGALPYIVFAKLSDKKLGCAKNFTFRTSIHTILQTLTAQTYHLVVANFGLVEPIHHYLHTNISCPSLYLATKPPLLKLRKPITWLWLALTWYKPSNKPLLPKLHKYTTYMWLTLAWFNLFIKPYLY